MRIALLQLCDFHFAVDVSRIAHIIETGRVICLPLLRKGYRGLMIYQNEPLPCVDLYQYFDYTDELLASVASSPITIVYNAENGVVGLPADKVLQVVDEADGELLAQEPATPESRLFVYRERQFRLFDIETLLSSFPDEPAAFQGG